MPRNPELFWIEVSIGAASLPQQVAKGFDLLPPLG